VILALLAGCAVWTGTGLVDKSADQLLLKTQYGDQYKLKDTKHAAPLEELNGFVVEATAWKSGKTLKVVHWEPISGPSGMQLWYGELVVREDGQLGIDDQITGGVYVIDRSESNLDNLIGQTLIVEGYVVGTVRLVAVSHTVVEVPEDG